MCNLVGKEIIVIVLWAYINGNLHLSLRVLRLRRRLILNLDFELKRKHVLYSYESRLNNPKNNYVLITNFYSNVILIPHFFNYFYNTIVMYIGTIAN